MKDKRRDFLKLSFLTGLGLTGLVNKNFAGKIWSDRQIPGQKFNMSGYSAPALDIVRVGFIGLGMRGPTHVKNLAKLEGVEIKGLCDIRPDKIMGIQKSLEGSVHKPAVYSGKDDWKRLCEQNDIDLIYIATPWAMHTPMALYAMQHGKHVAVEVPAAVTVDECWQLVETSEQTRKHCMMLENCCYDFFEMLTLNLARQDFFGEIVHTEGAYIHNLSGLNFDKNKGYWDMWRLKENGKRNGNLYP
ncbi:MAG TPA: Gfo/Idh/MocA family oxidoreductase, partial [Puia sp.]|nr:Gfo/Idh/MocA family oxidoreductase [Puia sp.]